MKDFFKGIVSRLKERKFSIAILALQLIASVALVVLVERLHMLNSLYIGLLSVAMLIVFVLTFMINGAKGKSHIVGQVISTVLVILFALAAGYVFKTRDTLGNMTGANMQSQKINIYVMKDSSAQKINDVADGTFAVFNLSSDTKVAETVKTINTNIDKTINTKEYSDAPSAVRALYNNEVQAVIMDESYVAVLEDDVVFKNFETETRILETYEHKTEVKNTAVSNVTKNPFTVFISGIDTFGDVNKKSRSDVNMTATVNPTTKQILLVSTPRDYYVNTTVSGEWKDKLTHAGIYGIDCSMGTLAKLYDTDINYFVRVNFSGFKDIVDALGGVTVHSDYTFTSDSTKPGYNFVKGDNQVDGERALAFARERHAFAAGDLQRNKDQQYLVKAIINKVSSPAILTSFNKLLESIQHNMTTNFAYNDIAAFVQMQLDNPAEWNIVMVGVSGEGKSRTTYSAQHQHAYVMYPNEVQVANASALIDRVMEGKTFTQDEATEIIKSRTLLEGDSLTTSVSPSPTASSSTTKKKSTSH